MGSLSLVTKMGAHLQRPSRYRKHLMISGKVVSSCAPLFVFDSARNINNQNWKRTRMFAHAVYGEWKEGGIILEVEEKYEYGRIDMFFFFAFAPFIGFLFSRVGLLLCNALSDIYAEGPPAVHASQMSNGNQKWMTSHGWLTSHGSSYTHIQCVRVSWNK